MLPVEDDGKGRMTTDRAIYSEPCVNETTSWLVAAATIISSSNYLMKSRVDDKKTDVRRRRKTRTVPRDAAVVDGIERGEDGRLIVLPLVTPTIHATAPAIAYKMLGAIRRLPPNCRFLSLPL